MSKLEELIAELCPNGVEYIALDSLVEYEQPTKYIVNSTNYNDEYQTPVLTAGQSFVLGYTNETDGIYHASKTKPVIIFDDFTAAFKWVDFQFKVKSSAMKILKVKSEKTFLRYIYHVMGKIGYSSDEHKRLWISSYSALKVPVPPLEVQREIVRVLDSFTLLTAELIAKLTAELTVRKTQYEFYRDMLLKRNDSVSVKTIDELCKVSAGGDVPKETMSKEKTVKYCIPIISNGVGENALYGYTDEAKIIEPAVTVAARGTIGHAEYRDYPYVPIIRLLSLIPKNADELDTKYLYYCLQGKTYNVSTAGIPQLTAPMIKQVQIPIPELAIQKKIVRVLDTFEKICNDLSNELPEEIEARKKQYEYYRDKLLSF